MHSATLMILRVALSAPVLRLFDYLPAAGPSHGDPAPGMRVLVPFGRSRRLGMIVELARETEQDPARLKPIDSLLDEVPLLGASDLEFILWAAAYYHNPPGEALFSALPARLRRPSPPVQSGEPGWQLTPDGRKGAAGLTRAPKQAQIARLLLESPSGLSSVELNRHLGNCRAALRTLAVRGWVQPCRIPLAARPESTVSSSTTGPKLNPHQRLAVEAVSKALGRFQAFLLEGVTSSGKTEVYIRLLQCLLAARRQALVLVPEISLTPQLLRRLAGRLAAPMVALHSALSAGEREQAWRRAAAGEAMVVLGTRSAVFVPLPLLGLILIDEEHDLSFKQQDGFRYSARDMAVRRAQQAGCPVVLGSATPSLESLHNARSGRYRLLELPERAGEAILPELLTLDIRAQPLHAGLSPVLLRLMKEQLAKKNQVLLFLNRRGFAPVLTCHDCGWIGECPRCDARLTLHLSTNRLWCHHCGLIRSIPDVCPDCRRTDLLPLGRGTERLEAELRDLFPGIPLARIDRDSTRRRGELDRLLRAARHGEIPLLLGTQMLAKGHHFPGVTLVGILDLDQGLYGTDFRAPERMAQLIVQVAGRAGRAQRSGRVVLQTRHPDHPLLLKLQSQGYPAFAAAALDERRLASLPPFSYQALMRAESKDTNAATEFLDQAARLASKLVDGDVTIAGPIPAPMERRGGRYRSHLLTQSNRRPALRMFLSNWLTEVRAIKGSSRVRWSLDVDPQEML
jgi:primosomal protein N' (replication factor Y)